MNDQPLNLSGGIVGDSAPTPAPASGQVPAGQRTGAPDLSSGIVGDTPSSSSTGTETNDLGKSIIVPKEGESFEETMRRAAASGAHVTQQDIDDEMKTAPRKAAEVALAAPAIGAAGAATLAATGEAGSAVKGTYEAASRALKPITDVALEQWQLLKSNPKLYTEWAIHQAVKWTIEHPKQAAELAGLGSGMAAAVKYLAGAGKKAGE
jgi:hypothetical protein